MGIQVTQSAIKPLEYNLKLEFLKIIELIRHEKSDVNGRLYTTARINSKK